MRPGSRVSLPARTPPRLPDTPERVCLSRPGVRETRSRRGRPVGGGGQTLRSGVDGGPRRQGRGRGGALTWGTRFVNQCLFLYSCSMLCYDSFVLFCRYFLFLSFPLCVFDILCRHSSLREAASEQAPRRARRELESFPVEKKTAFSLQIKPAVISCRRNLLGGNVGLTLTLIMLVGMILREEKIP